MFWSMLVLRQSRESVFFDNSILFCFFVCREDDHNWPQPDRVGRQELEVVCGNDHISFVVCNWLCVMLLFPTSAAFIFPLLSPLSCACYFSCLLRLVSVDLKDWLNGRSWTKQGSRRSQSVLFSGSRFKNSYLLTHRNALQGSYSIVLAVLTVFCWFPNHFFDSFYYVVLLFCFSLFRSSQYDFAK